MRSIGKILLLAVLLAVVGYCAKRTFFPGSRVPWWYDNNQLGWEIAHMVTPAGVDKTSDYIIALDGIECCQWDREDVEASTFNRDLHLEWQGEKLLARYGTGKSGIFSGSAQVHLPLNCDPRESGKSLHECLAVGDDGRSVPAFRNPTFAEMLGAK